jgi:hypothetical protein
MLAWMAAASSLVVMIAVDPESRIARLVATPVAFPPTLTLNSGTVQYALSMTGACRMRPA